MRRWLFILLIVALSGWFSPTVSRCYTLKATPNYDAAFAVRRVELGECIRSGDPNVYVYDGEAQVFHPYGRDQAQKSGSSSVYDAVGITLQTGHAAFAYIYDAHAIPSSHIGEVKRDCRYDGSAPARIGGRYYLRAGYYKPDLGRFWTMDTFEGSQYDPVSLHKYLYCGSDPVNRMDPSGNDFSIINLTVTTAIRGGIAGFTAGGISTAYSYAKGASLQASLMQGAKVGGLVAFSWVSPLAAVSFAGGGLVNLGVDIWAGDFSKMDAAELGTQLTAGVALYILFKGGYLGPMEASGSAPLDAHNAALFDKLKQSYAAQEIKNSTAIGSALKSDAAHAAAFWAQELAQKGKVFGIVGGDGVKRTLTQTLGEMNGKQGVFEWIVDEKGNLTHQRFIEGGKITGEANQK